MKAHHTLSTGDSGGGKTTLMRELFHSPGFQCRCVWVNHNDTDGLEGYGGRDAERVESVGELRRSTARSVNFVVPENKQARAVEEAKEFARDYWEAHGVPVQVFIDECHDVWPDRGDDTSENALKWMLHEGRDMGVVVRMATQDPSDLKPYTPLKQCRLLAWVGEWSGWHEGFLNAHKWIPREKLPTEAHRYVVLNKRGDVEFRGETKEKYA